MKKEAKKRVSGPRLGGSSFLNMNFKSEGIYWVKGICEKFETSCNAYADACSQYVNSAGEHFKRIYDEMYEWDDQYNLDEESSSSFSSEQNSSVETDTNISEKKSSVCDNFQETVTMSAQPPVGMSSHEPHVSLPDIDICNEDEPTEVSKRYDCIREESIQNSALVSSNNIGIGHIVSSESFTEDFSNENASICERLLKVGSTLQDQSRTIFSNESRSDSSRDVCDIVKVETLSTEDTCVHDAEEGCAKVLSKSSAEEFSDEDVSVNGRLLQTGSTSENLSRFSSFNESQEFCSTDVRDNFKEESLSTMVASQAHDSQEGCVEMSVNSCFTNCASSINPNYFPISTSQCDGGSSLDSGTCASKHSMHLSSSQTKHNMGSGELLPTISNGTEQNISSSHDGVNMEAELEVFEDIELEDRWSAINMNENDIDMNEFALISERKAKNMSYKKKLSKFISKARYRKMYNPVDHKLDVVNAGPNRDQHLLNQNSVESDWELV